MAKLKFISFFLSLLIAIQLLPIQQIGQALGKNTWTEELPHNEEGGSKSGSAINHPYLPPVNYTTVDTHYSENKASAYLHLSYQIPSNHSTEVVSPPPDVAITT